MTSPSERVARRLDAQIDPHHRSGVLGDCLLLFHLQTHIPVPSLLTDCGREDLDPTGRQIPTFFEPQPSQARQHDRLQQTQQWSR